MGLPLGIELVRRGHEVFGLRRDVSSGELEHLGIKPLALDITDRHAVLRIKGPFDWVVNTVSSTRGGAEDYRAVYLEATRHLIDLFSRHPIQRYVYTSSTSVYAQTDGSWVTEESPTEPQSETSQVLVKTERRLLAATLATKFPAIILRVAGIYGPERGHLFQLYLRGEAQITGDGSRLINMIHRDDVVTAIIAALERGVPGRIYNVADDEPVTQREFFGWLSDKLAMPLPSVAQQEVPRKRGVTNKRVSNRKLRDELQCELKYPTFRQGYAAEITRLQATGQVLAGTGGR